MSRKELIFPILILAAAVLGTAVLILRGDDLAKYLQDDVFKLLAQLILVSGIGGIISLALSEFTRARERRQQLRDLQRKAFSDLIEAYHEVKRLRRLLRARAVRLGPKGKKEIVERDEYDTLLQRLNDAQLQCEFYKRYAEGNQDIYGAAGPELAANLDQAEKYLGNVISEWEKKLAEFSGNPPVMPLSELSDLKQFIDKAYKGGFDVSVAQPMANAFRSLTKQIAK